MKVMFVSECRGKALKTTRRILDMYAVRTGSRTWLTDITEEGLKTVRAALVAKETARTAVQCLVVNRSNTIRKWVVGDRNVFGPEGEYPMSKTGKDCTCEDEASWAVIPVVSALTALAALLHDIGKLSIWFQEKLKKEAVIADPIRHEYISCMLLRLFVEQTEAKTDKEWLEKIHEIDVAGLFDGLTSRVTIDRHRMAEPRNPFLDMQDFPVFLSLCWLIVSHHRLPYLRVKKEDIRKGLSLDKEIDWRSLGDFIEGDAGYVNPLTCDNASDDLSVARDCLLTSYTLDDPHWRKLLEKHAERLVSQMSLHPEAFGKPDYTVLIMSLTSLMFGDHTFSARDCRDVKSGPYANTLTEKGRRHLNQGLAQHLVGVCSEALWFVHMIPRFSRLDKAHDIEWLEKRSTGRFGWQEKAAEAIAGIREKTPDGGFFIVNMAGTGCGKTLGNAKMLHALSGDGLRGTVALGLRTLTAQTGREYRDRMGLYEDDLCIAMGSREAVELAEMTDEDSSPEPLVGADIIDGKSPKLFPTDRCGLMSRFLGSPVLVCTTDQMVKATESMSGGKGIIPMARLISSDLVIDEIDEYTDSALVSVGRLIYAAGVCGRNVIISSATIVPEISLNLKHYYDLGYREFARWHGKPDVTVGLVTDEFGCAGFGSEDEYFGFCRRHAERIRKAPACRKVEITDIPLSGNREDDIVSFNRTILDTIRTMHVRHACQVNGKNVSFGLVRFANIGELDRFALYLGSQKDDNIHVVVYHSRFPLVDRHRKEDYLDRVLCRKDPWAIFTDHVVAAHMGKAERDAVFVVLASPVEELGRDHDFDWAVIEPSSYRSIIQTAGRVQRHRLLVPSEPNVAILQYPFLYVKGGDGPFFCRPGFESDRNPFPSHDIAQLCDADALLNGLTSAVRVLPAGDVTEPFAEKEHEVTGQWLDPKTIHAGKVAGFIGGFFLTSLPGKFAPLRDSRHDMRLVYKHVGKGKMGFMEADDPKKRNEVTKSQNITFLDGCDLPSMWLEEDHDGIVEDIAEKAGMSKERFENRYSIIDIPDNRDPGKKQRKYLFNEMLGLFYLE